MLYSLVGATPIRACVCYPFLLQFMCKPAYSSWSIRTAVLSAAFPCFDLSLALANRVPVVVNVALRFKEACDVKAGGRNMSKGQSDA